MMGRCRCLDRGGYLHSPQLLDCDSPPPLDPGGPGLVLVGCVNSEESRDFPREITAKEKY